MLLGKVHRQLFEEKSFLIEDGMPNSELLDKVRKQIWLKYYVRKF